MSSIIGNLPVDLANGTEADASQVMEDLNYIVNQVNANAVASGSAPNFAGTVTVVQASNTNGLDLNGATNNQGSSIYMLGNGATTPSKTVHVQNGNFYVANDAYNSNILTLDDTGDLTVTGNLTANSDVRLKTDIEVITCALTKVKALKGITYRRRDIEGALRNTGLIAQDVQAVLPEAVREGNEGFLSVAYGNLVGLLVEAIKELADEVEALKAAK
jgi:hypothetical protein